MRAVISLFSLCALAGASVAHAATCTVSDGSVLVTNFGLAATLPLQGLALPVQITTDGTFSIDFTNFPLTGFDIVGVASTVDFPAQSFVGTIDGSGNISVPDVPIDLVTQATDPPTPVGTTATLTTGATTLTISGKDYVTEGSVLDFTTGTLKLAGEGTIGNAPLAGMPVTTGISLTCTLDTIPAASSLPSAPTLMHATGKGKVGKVTTDDPAGGDSLVLKGKVVAGATPIDFAGNDLFLHVPGVVEQLPDDSLNDHSILVRVPAGSLTAKGKKLVTTDPAAVRIALGRKQTGNDLAVVSGAVTVKQTKHGATVAFSVKGVDLSQLVVGGTTVTIGSGRLSANHAATLAQKKKGITIH
jgi:hypothetical protein